MTRFDILKSKIFQKKRRARRSIDPSNDGNDHDPDPNLGANENILDKKQGTDGNPVPPADHPIQPAVTLPPEASQSEGPLADDRPQETSKNTDNAHLGAAHGISSVLDSASPPDLHNQPPSECKLPSSSNPSSSPNSKPNPTVEFLDRVTQTPHPYNDCPFPRHDQDRQEKETNENKGKGHGKPPIEYVSTGCQTNLPDHNHSPSFNSSSFSNFPGQNIVQCCAVTKAGTRCSIFVKIQNDHDYFHTSHIPSDFFCHIHKRTQGAENAQFSSSGHTHTVPNGPSVKIRIDVTHSTSVQCSGMTKKGTRCGKMVKPRDNAAPSFAYCHLHLSQQCYQQHQQQHQCPAVRKDTCQSSCRTTPEPDIKFPAFTSHSPCSSRSSCSGVGVVVSVQCRGKVRGGEQCRRHVSSVDGVSPAYCFQHASQRFSDTDVFVETIIEL